MAEPSVQSSGVLNPVVAGGVVAQVTLTSGGIFEVAFHIYEDGWNNINVKQNTVTLFQPKVCNGYSPHKLTIQGVAGDVISVSAINDTYGVVYADLIVRRVSLT